VLTCGEIVPADFDVKRFDVKRIEGDEAAAELADAIPAAIAAAGRIDHARPGGKLSI
jgi:hypothetical protein